MPDRSSQTDRVGRPFVAVLVGITLVVSIISSLGAPLLPDVAKDLSVSLPSAQWSLTAALIAGAIAAPVLGRLGDGRHRRRSILGALLVVTAGGVIAGLADSLPVLVVGRVMQGFGLGLAPIAMAAARDHLDGEDARRTIALLSVSAATGLGAGYPISGLIAEQFNLHAAFFFGAILSAAAVVAAYLVIPSNKDGAAVSLDVNGAVVGAVAVVALALARATNGAGSRPTPSLASPSPSSSSSSGPGDSCARRRRLSTSPSSVTARSSVPTSPRACSGSRSTSSSP